MKYVILGFVLWFTLIMPGSARSAEKEVFEEGVYPIVIFSEPMRRFVDRRWYGEWQECGDYFAVDETRGTKVLRFGYLKFPPYDALTQIILSTPGRIIISRDESVTTPMVIVRGEETRRYFILQMNDKDFQAGLPCLPKDMEI